MLTVITSIIFFGMIASQIIISLKIYSLKEILRNKQIAVQPWSRFTAIKKFNEIADETDDEYVREVAEKIIRLLEKATLFFFAAPVLIILVFILNAIFKWQQ